MSKPTAIPLQGVDFQRQQMNEGSRHCYGHLNEQPRSYLQTQRRRPSGSINRQCVGSSSLSRRKSTDEAPRRHSSCVQSCSCCSFCRLLQKSQTSLEGMRMLQSRLISDILCGAFPVSPCSFRTRRTLSLIFASVVSAINNELASYRCLLAFYVEGPLLRETLQRSPYDGGTIEYGTASRSGIDIRGESPKQKVTSYDLCS